MYLDKRYGLDDVFYDAKNVIVYTALKTPGSGAQELETSMLILYANGTTLVDKVVTRVFDLPEEVLLLNTTCGGTT